MWQVRIGKFQRKKPFKGVKVHRFELTETLHPDRRHPHRVRLQLAPFHPAAFFLGNQTGPGEEDEVFGNGGKRDRKGVGDVGDGHVVFQQHRQDRPASRVGEGSKDGVQGVGHCGSIHGHRAMVNRMVEYILRIQGRASGQTAFQARSIKVLYFTYLVECRHPLSLLDTVPPTF